MLSRPRMVVLSAVGVMAAIVIVISLRQVAHYDSQQSTAAGVPAPLAIGTALERPLMVPSLHLVDAQGKATSLAAWRGKWIVLAPSMTLCSEVCPMTTGALTQLQGELRTAGLAKRVTVMEATVDPWRDTPARLRAYQRMTGTDLTMLTGSKAEIHKLWKFFGVYYRRVPEGKPPDIDWLTHKPLTFDVQHTDGVFIIDPAGHERIVDAGMPDVGGRLSRTLRSLLDAQGRDDLADPQFPWTAGELMQDLYNLMNLNVPASSLPKVKPPTRAQAATELADSPHPLAALHTQAGRLLAAYASLPAELRALHGYPVVINLWASWCPACRSEFSLFASASATYGRRVAFLGNDTNDAAGDAREFLTGHPVSYPSFQDSTSSLSSIVQLEGLPTTVFINRAGSVVHVNSGSYDSPTTLDQDIERYALGG